MPTTLPNGGHLTLDRGYQIGDVLLLEQLLAQRLERRLSLGRRRSGLAVVAVAQFVDPPLVLLALALDRRARLLEPGAKLGVVFARLTERPDLVQFLVKREHFLEQRRGHLDAAFIRFRG